jgi:hypothetical protein
MKNLISILIFILGITILFNAETGKGVVYINGTNKDCVYILMPSIDRVERLEINPNMSLSFTNWVKIFKEANFSEKFMDSIISVITPAEKAAGIEY